MVVKEVWINTICSISKLFAQMSRQAVSNEILNFFAMMNSFGTVSPHFCLSCRLESQMTTDIQTILQLLQKQTTVVPPAYSMVAAGAEYQRPVFHLMATSHPGASIKTDRSFSPSSQVSTDCVQPRV